MPKRDKPPFQYRSNASLRRGAPSREPRAYVLIVCEGEKTEPNYFKALREDKKLKTTEVKVIGEECGSHPRDVVDFAVKEKRRQERKGIPYNQVWCVFDRDEHSKIHEAFDRAKAHGIEIAFSNPCFELWFLLHFINYSSAHIERDEVDRQLRNSHIPGYEVSMQVYDLLIELQQNAIRNAERLRIHHESVNPGEYPNPYTSVDRLVAFLNYLEQP